MKASKEKYGKYIMFDSLTFIIGIDGYVNIVTDARNVVYLHICLKHKKVDFPNLAKDQTQSFNKTKYCPHMTPSGAPFINMDYDFIPHITGNVSTYLCSDLKLIGVAKRGPMRQ